MGVCPKLLTVAEAEEQTSLALRHRIFENTEGFADRCVIRFGRSVRIDAEALAEFLEERRGVPPSTRYTYTKRPEEAEEEAS